MSTYNAKQIQYLKFTAVRSLVGDSGQFNISGDGVVTYLTGTTAKTDSQITAEMTRIQGVYDGLAYARDRKAKYDLLNQFELMTDDAANSTTTHAEAIAAIKAAHPKP
tara:strand:- start:36 stop:359 length:324 start_codon:yes stop_codon:yes gene_type:complete